MNANPKILHRLSFYDEKKSTTSNQEIFSSYVNCLSFKI